MAKNQVNVVQLKPFQGCLRTFKNMLAAEACVVWPLPAPEDFSGEYQVTPLPSKFLQRLTHDYLGFSPGVCFGVVEEIHTCVIGDLHHIRRCIDINLRPEGNPRAV